MGRNDSKDERLVDLKADVSIDIVFSWLLITSSENLDLVLSEEKNITWVWVKITELHCTMNFYTQLVGLEKDAKVCK